MISSLIIKHPSNICSEKNTCTKCLINWEPYVYDKDALQLFKIDYWDFHLKQKEMPTGEDILYKCEGRINKCTCGCGYNESWNRTPQYCKYESCKPESIGICDVQPADMDLILSYMGKKTINPKIYSFKVCYFQEWDYNFSTQKLHTVEEIREKENQALIGF